MDTSSPFLVGFVISTVIRETEIADHRTSYVKLCEKIQRRLLPISSSLPRRTTHSAATTPLPLLFTCMLARVQMQAWWAIEASLRHLSLPLSPRLGETENKKKRS